MSPNTPKVIVDFERQRVCIFEKFMMNDLYIELYAHIDNAIIFRLLHVLVEKLPTRMLSFRESRMRKC